MNIFAGFGIYPENRLRKERTLWIKKNKLLKTKLVAMM